MSPNIDNQQDRLAEIFRQTDNQIIQESKVAFLKIQSWQFAVRTPDTARSHSPSNHTRTGNAPAGRSGSYTKAKR